MGQNDLYDFKSFLSFCSNICTVSTGLWVFFFSVVSPFLSFQINNRGKKTTATLWNHIWHLLSGGLGYFRAWFMLCAFICQLLHLAEALLCDWGPMTLNNGHDVVLQNIRTMLTSWNVNYHNFTQVDIDIKKKNAGYQNRITSSINPKQTWVRDGAKYVSGFLWIIGLF